MSNVGSHQGPAPALPLSTSIPISTSVSTEIHGPRAPVVPHSRCHSRNTPLLCLKVPLLLFFSLFAFPCLAHSLNHQAPTLPSNKQTFWVPS